MVIFRHHEISIAVGQRLRRWPVLAIAAGECGELAFAHEASTVVCAAVRRANLRDAAGGAAKRAGADAASSRTGCAQCHADVSGDGTPAPDGPEP